MTHAPLRSIHTAAFIRMSRVESGPSSNAIRGASLEDGEGEIVAGFLLPTTGGGASRDEGKGGLSPGITLVVCTKGRSDSVARLLESISVQVTPPACLVVVDASADDSTERVLSAWGRRGPRSSEIRYYRITGRLMGLTRQRAFGLRCVSTEVVAFMDDDVVLDPMCLEEIKRAFGSRESKVIGVGAWVDEGNYGVSVLWKLRRILGVVTELRAGAYCRTGYSLPWSFLARTDETVPADWLPGCAMCFRTEIAKEIGFSTQFIGYSAAEDLEFSLLMARRGRLVVVGKARVRHLKDPNQRPRSFELGVSTAGNAHFIHRTCLERRTVLDAARFTYAFWVDTLLRLIAAAARFKVDRGLWLFLAGRLWFLVSRHALGRTGVDAPRLPGKGLGASMVRSDGLIVPGYQDFPAATGRNAKRRL